MGFYLLPLMSILRGILGLVFLPFQGLQIQLDLKNARPIFPNMLRTLPLGTPNNTVKSLAIFRQQLEESYHNLVNMLT